MMGGVQVKRKDINDLNDLSVVLMVRSGARGKIDQIVQLGGMRGLLRDMMNRDLTPSVTRNFREGVSPLEYYLGSHAARRSMAEKKLFTAQAGDFTRLMVEAAYPLVIAGEDCGTDEGICICPRPVIEVSPFNKMEGLASRVLGRCEAGSARIIDDRLAQTAEEAGKPVCVRSVLTCLGHARWGEGAVCQRCYGWDLSTRQLPEIGLPVGIIAGQSIGERGTQLTMRTFHTGGVGEDNITAGLPRIKKLFGNQEIEVPLYSVSNGTGLKVLNEWHLLIKASRWEKSNHFPQVEAIKGEYDRMRLGDLIGASGHVEEFQTVLAFEARKIYGRDVNDKHFEVIGRSMLVETEQGLGVSNITKVPFGRPGFLAAASFRSALSVLSNAALSEQSDGLTGYKAGLFTGKTLGKEVEDDRPENKARPKARTNGDRCCRPGADTKRTAKA